jgi:hypothetical protein
MAENQLSPHARIAVGVILIAGGLLLTVVSFRKVLLVVNPLQDEHALGVLLGLCVLLSGATITLPPVVAFRQRLFQALTISCMALMFDWIAFVPGPREFHAGTSASHPGAPVNSIFGRVVFGFGAILMDLFAVYVWRLTIRLLTTGSESERPADATND